ncbi:hypothetical protein MHN79_01545 [Vibrio sp. Of14-4]|uniref:hypothetical protein n=1 Tax=Vibrio sp. Of14-4 TaxID=2724878 RepID=UPI001EF3900A|nr:hypothetical protein [Vibrio sp. Of14-4]MCG7488159.1 hypothetical protein [Vibrio sp. Of14-4]
MKYRYFIMAGLIFPSWSALSTPNINRCENINIPFENNQLYFDQSCSTAYVVPKGNGTIKEGSFTPNSYGRNICSHYRSTADAIERVDNELLDFYKKFAENVEKKIELINRVYELNIKIISVKEQYEDEISKYERAQADMDFLRDEYIELSRELSSCKNISNECSFEQEEVDRVRADLIVAAQEVSEANKGYEIPKAIIKSAEKAILSAEEQLALLEYHEKTHLETMKSVKDNLMQMLTKYSYTEAGDALFTFDLEHQALVEELAEKYSHLGLNWEKMPATKVDASTLSLFNSSVLSIDAQNLLPVVETYIVGQGRPSPGFNTIGKQQISPEGPRSAADMQSSAPSNDIVKAGFKVNAISACNLDNDSSLNQMVKVIKPSLYFQYGVDVSSGYTAHVNTKALIDATEIRQSSDYSVWLKPWAKANTTSDLNSLININFDSAVPEDIQFKVARSVLERTALSYMDNLGKRVPIPPYSTVGIASGAELPSIDRGYETVSAYRSVYFIWSKFSQQEEDTISARDRYFWDNTEATYSESIASSYMLPQSKLISFEIAQ